MLDWVPLNLTESRVALQRWNTMEQRGQWMVGFHQGASGAVLIGGEPPAFADGFACGERAHNDSAAHRNEVSERRRESAKKRWNRDDDANAHANATTFASCKTHAQDKTRQDITNKTKTPASQTNSELPRAHEEPPAPPPEPPAAPAEPETEPEGFSPEFQALAARLRSSQEVREFGFGGPPPTIQPPPPVEAPAAPAPVSAEERARLEALPGDKRPSREDFVRFAFAIAPKWREARSVFDTWVIRNWTIPPPIGSKQHAPQKIRNWRGALKNEIAGDGDPRHWMEMLPMGHLLKGDEK